MEPCLGFLSQEDPVAHLPVCGAQASLRHASPCMCDPWASLRHARPHVHDGQVSLTRSFMVPSYMVTDLLLAGGNLRGYLTPLNLPPWVLVTPSPWLPGWGLPRVHEGLTGDPVPPLPTAVAGPPHFGGRVLLGCSHQPCHPCPHSELFVPRADGPGVELVTQ